MSWYVEMQVWVLGGSHFLEQNQKVRVRYIVCFLTNGSQKLKNQFWPLTRGSKKKHRANFWPLTQG